MESSNFELEKSDHRDCIQDHAKIDNSVQAYCFHLPKLISLSFVSRQKIIW